MRQLVENGYGGSGLLGSPGLTWGLLGAAAGLLDGQGIGRGLLTGGWQPGQDSPGDFRHHAPRFQGEAGAKNASVAAEIARVAHGFGMSAGQLLLAWVLAQGEDIVPLVGARKPGRVTEAVEALAHQLTPDQLAEIARAIPPDAIAGERYAPAMMAQLDSER